MKPKDSYSVQTYVRDRKGALVSRLATACGSADEARKLAERRVSGGRAAGAAAFHRVGAGDFDEGEAIAIATYGQVPAGFADALPF